MKPLPSQLSIVFNWITTIYPVMLISAFQFQYYAWIRLI